jgi:protein-tyrosine phosphatase
MKQILPHSLWLGHAGEGGDFRQLFDNDIKALVLLAAEDPLPPAPREVIACRFPLLDGPGNRGDLLFLAISTLATLLKMHMPTLVCCSSGMSRSPAVAAAALAMIHQEAPEEWLKRVVEHHPSDVSPGFWSEVTSVLSSGG